MIYQVVENCSITKSSADIIAPYVDNMNDPWYNTLKGYHSGVDISATDVYSICEGVVIEVGRNTDGKVVTIQYNASICVRYCHLQSTDLRLGEAITSGSKIGIADDFVHFEFANNQQLESFWAIRISDLQYYKHNPIQYADGTLTLVDGGRSDVTIVQGQSFNEVPLTGTMVSEFSNGRSQI